mgnify:CR=1 FL=1
MKRRKLISVLLAATMMAAMFAGCGSDAASTDAKENADGADSTEAGGVKEFTAFFAVPGSEINDDNEIQQIIADKTGVKVKETWLTGQTAEEAVGMMITGGELPDFICGGSGQSQLYDADVLVALDDYLDDYPNIKNFFTQQQWDQLRQDDGHIYWIPQFSNIKGEEKVCTHNDEAFWIQARVLKWADYPEIRTMDQYFDLIEAYNAANPTMEDGTANIPYTILCDDWRYFCLENAPQFLDGYPNDGSCMVDPETLTVLDYNTSDTAVKYFRKLNEEGNILDGAKYDVVVTRPDGTKIIKRDLEITDKVEFEGFLASKGTVIEITEKEAPLGYKVNEYTETLRISEVSEDGSVSVDLEDAGYAVSRASIKDIQNTKLSDGTMKTFVTLDLIDQNLNTFKLGITTKDSVSSKGVSDFKYYLYTNKGAQVESGETNSEGKVTTLVGASYAGQTVQYTIKELETAKYYKGLKTIVTLNIVYSEDGTVDAIETLAAQTDPNYKTKWDILATNTESGNDIDIVIYNDPQDSFKVQLETVDRVTGQKVDNIEYQVRPSINLEGKGTTDIDVGYVVPSSLEVYTLRQLTTLDLSLIHI